MNNLIFNSPRHAIRVLNKAKVLKASINNIIYNGCVCDACLGMQSKDVKSAVSCLGGLEKWKQVGNKGYGIYSIGFDINGKRI